MKNFFLALFILCISPAFLFSQSLSGDAVLQKTFEGYSTSWIGNDGGYEEVHVPHDMLNMYVRSDGMVATVCGWDEGGTNVGVFKDGRLVSRPEGSGTGGWGRFSGCAVVMDDKYVYQLLAQNGCDGANRDLNVNGLPQFPPCDPAKEWKVVRRYHVSDGKGAAFPGGYGYKGDMLLVACGKRELKGLAVDDKNLYVTVTGDSRNMPDSVKVYDRITLEYAGGFPVADGVGAICRDAKDGLWMMQERRIVCFSVATGQLKPQSVSLPEHVVASNFSIDLEKGRMLVPNSGRDLNILIYEEIYTSPVLTGTFGERGGILSRTEKHLSGETAPLHFGGPRAVGADSRGNIFVANTFVAGGRGTSLEAYREKKGKLLWKLEGLIFTAVGDFDTERPDWVYTPEKIHQIDEKKHGGRLDKLLAFTVDPFRFPEDERCRPGGPFITSCFKRSLFGHDYLFVSDMYGGMLAGYRFDKPNYGYIAIPCLTVGNGNVDRKEPVCLWTDGNGDGKKQANEIDSVPEINQYSMSFFVDRKGNIWRGLRERGFCMWPLLGITAEGLPRYGGMKHFQLPEGFTDAKRIWYDADRDELFLGGFSLHARDRGDTWWAMGSTIVCCRDFIKRFGEKVSASASFKPDMVLYLPFSPEDGSGKDHFNAKAFAAEGDYIFVVLAREGRVVVYDKADGDYVATLFPGENVHGQSGWCDFNYAINARKNKNGSYDVLVEENAFAKVLFYHIPDMKKIIPVDGK